MSTPTSALARPHPPAIGTVSSSRLDVAALADIATGLAEAEELWRPHVVHDGVERARVRLLATPVYEVWLLGWTPGQSVGLHDHGDANGAFVVVDGTLTETSSTAAVDRTLGRRPCSAPATSAWSRPARCTTSPTARPATPRASTPTRAR